MDAPGRSGIFNVRLEVERPTYTVGQQIRLRVTLTNTSGKHYGVSWRPPYDLAKLQILDAAGGIISQDSPGGGKLFPISAPQIMEFEPGQSITQLVNDPPDGHHPKDWFDLQSWGYDLTQPGSYSIKAIATLSVFERTSAATSSNSTVVVTSPYVRVMINPAPARKPSHSPL